MESKQIIVVNRSLQMPPGKLASQVAHAAMAFMSRRIGDVKWGHDASILWPGAWNWLNGSFTKVVVGVDSEKELLKIATLAQMRGLEVNSIVDDGRTIFDGVKTLTAVAIGPEFVDKFVGVTDHLELL